MDLFLPESYSTAGSYLRTPDLNIFLLIIDVARPIVLGKKIMVEVKAASEIRYYNELRAAFIERVWPGCSSYYQDEHGRNVVLYPWPRFISIP